MGDTKPWQIVVLVAAVVAVGSSLYFSLARGEKLDLATSIQMVDVNSGELYRLKIGKGGASIPGTNPSTKSVTLLPVEERDGKWYLRERYLSSLKNLEGKHEAVADAKTGEIRVKTTSNGG